MYIIIIVPIKLVLKVITFLKELADIISKAHARLTTVTLWNREK